MQRFQNMKTRRRKLLSLMYLHFSLYVMLIYSSSHFFFQILYNLIFLMNTLEKISEATTG